MVSGNCVICNKAAVQSCAHCGTISYCGKEHQKEHWPLHKTVCKPYKIEISHELGRYMVASRDIKPGELIVKESPAVMGPRMDSVPLCLGCYNPVNGDESQGRLCSKCEMAPVCSANCETESHHSEAECQLFSRLGKGTGGFTSLTSDMGLVMPVRCLLMRPVGDRFDVRWESFLKLESHSVERENTPIWYHNQDKIINVLKSAEVLNGAEDERLMHKICGILDVNSFELRGPNPAVMTHSSKLGERLRGLYMEAALMSHDCIGNTHLAVDDGYTMSVHASVLIKAGDPILFNYASTLESTAERLHRLKEGKYFNCNCKRCSDPTEMGTYMGSMICSTCHEGFVVPSNPLDGEECKWLCEKCNHAYHSRLIKAAFAQAWSEIEEADNTDSRSLEIMLKRFSRTFPKSSVVILEIKQNLIALYRDVILREPSPSRKIMQRKINLCEELLKVLNIVEPGISRLRGITLYELHVPMVLLANREYDGNEINADTLLSRLLDSENILTEAISMLLYEPCKSPEGRLLRVAIDQLRILRQNIQDVKHLREAKTADGSKKRRNVHQEH